MRPPTDASRISSYQGDASRTPLAREHITPETSLHQLGPRPVGTAADAFVVPAAARARHMCVVARDDRCIVTASRDLGTDAADGVRIGSRVLPRRVRSPVARVT